MTSPWDVFPDGMPEPEPYGEPEEQEQETPSAVIVAVPAVTTPLPRAPGEELHCTLAYVENPDDVMMMALLELAQQTAGVFPPFDAEISGHGRLGDQDAAVLLLESDDLAGLHTVIEDDACVPESKFPNWIPHLTLGWGDGFSIETLDMSTLPERITFDTLAVWSGDERHQFALSGVPMDPEAEEDDDWDSSTGISIPEIDGPDDLDLAVTYASANPQARWYVRKRATALGVESLLPESWMAPTALSAAGVEAAAEYYVRMAQESMPPPEDVYATMLASAEALEMRNHPAVCSAVAWRTWLAASC